MEWPKCYSIKKVCLEEKEWNGQNASLLSKTLRREHVLCIWVHFLDLPNIKDAKKTIQKNSSHIKIMGF